jgi:hypothetical protein
MNELKTGKCATKRRQFALDSVWYQRGSFRQIENHLLGLHYHGLMKLDQQLLDRLPQVANIRPEGEAKIVHLK